MLLFIRLVTEAVFAHHFPAFMTIADQRKETFFKINILLTQLLDPQHYFSRLALLESSIEALGCKFVEPFTHKLNAVSPSV